MVCEDVRSALASFATCEETSDGARIATHCLYPSFETAYVYVVRIGEQYRVHDGGEAFRTAWTHGRDENAINRAISAEAARFHLSVSNNQLVSQEVSAEWIAAAVLSVANASTFAANAAVARFIAAAEEALTERINRILVSTVPAERIAREFAVKGKSGGERRFDFAVRVGDEYGLLINGVSAHHSSIAAKFVAFSDVEAPIEFKFAVYDGRLETEDTALMQQVASIVPLARLNDGTKRALTAPALWRREDRPDIKPL
jgi:hypothetical protein